MKIKLRQKVGRKKNVLSEQENQFILTYTTPAKRAYLGKFNKVKKFAQKCHLLWTIQDIVDMINGSNIMESSSTKGIIGFFANSTICSSVTNNEFWIERSHNGLVSKKFVKIYFSGCGWQPLWFMPWRL